MQPIRISLFRKFCVEHDERELVGLDSLRVQELFGYLLIYRSRPHTRDRLAGILWRDSPASQAKKYLRQALWQLQSCLNGANAGPLPLVQVNADWIQANVTPRLSLDVDTFERTYALVRGTDGRELNVEQVAALKTAVALYRGDLLEDWYHDWCIFERERLQNIYLAMLDKLLHYHEYIGAYEAGMSYGMQLLRCDRAHERTYRSLMRLHYLAGDRTGALRQFRRCEKVLHRELNVAPSRRTRELYRQVQSDRLMEPVITQAAVPDAPTAQPPAPLTLPEVLEHLLQLKQSLAQTQHELEDALDIVMTALSEQHESAFSAD